VIDNVKTIYHLADIHIRLYQRQGEYEEVFENLYKEIEKDTKDAITFIAGDMVHSKTQLSPELIRVCSNFLKRLSKITPVVIIPGNHDLNLSNETRLDAITPIIESINSDNIFYWKDSGIYTFGNLNFYHSSVTDKRKFEDTELLDEGVHIGCFHGPVQGSRNYLGTKFKSEEFNFGYFSKFDITLLGDIHLPNQSIVNETIKYPGSLIMQNHGEAPTEDHGILKWNIENLTSEFIPIENKYGYVTFKVSNGIIEEEPLNIPEKPRVRIFIKDTTMAQVKDIVTDLNKRYKVASLSVVPTGSGTNTTQLGNANINDVNNVSNQEKLLRVWLKNNIDKITKKQIDEIVEINRKLNTALPEREVLTGSQWSLKNFSFSNMFSYGEDNYIDFETLQGSVGLFGLNHSGKSTLLESLMFTMFDKCSRANRGVDILNVAKDEFNSKLCFTYEGQDYFIERKGKRTNKSVKIDADFYTIDSNGNKQDLSGVDRKDTYKRIKKYLGEYDIFVNTLVSLQNNSSGFVYQKQSERKAFLADLLGIAIFEQLRLLASNETKESEVLLKEFKKTNFERILADTEVQLDNDEKKFTELKEVLTKTKSDIKELNKKIIEDIKTLKDVPDDVLNLDRETLLIKETKYKDSIIKKQNEKKDILSKQNEAKIQVEDLNKIADKAKNIPNKYDEYLEIQKEQNEVFNRWDREKINVGVMESTSNKLLKLEYDSDCKYCMNNIFVKDAIEIKSQLTKKQEILAKLKKELDEINSKLEEYKDIKNKNKQYIELTKRINKLNLLLGESFTLLARKDLDIVNDENNLSKIQEKIELYEKVKDYISFNEKVQEIITLKKKRLKELEKTQGLQEEQIERLNGNIAIQKERIINYRKSMKDMDEIENKLTIYKYYLKAVHKDGIPKLLIKESIPMIEMKINNILELITDFSVKFDVDDSSIIASIYYNENNFWPVELTSGFEKFIIGLAIRIALTQISNLSYSNFIIIDEGWGNFDAENLGNVGKIFEYLENNFKFILIVSHIDALKDTVNDMIEINVNDGESHINNMTI
jgi:DNA repair exonuclease SbcCD ATPase subunit